MPFILALKCHLTSTSRPLFLKLLIRWFSKPAFSAMAVRGFAQLRLSGYPPCEKRHGSSCAAAAAAGSREEAEDDVTERRGEELMYTSYIGCPTKAIYSEINRGF